MYTWPTSPTLDIKHPADQPPMIFFYAIFSAPSEPINVRAVDSSNMSITVSWTVPSMPNGVIRGYIVSYFISDLGIRNMSQQNVTADKTTTEIVGLGAFTNYTVFVEGFTVVVGARSDAITVVTNEGGKIMLICN